LAVKNYIWYNGDLLDGSTPVLTIANRSFSYGDGLFETIHAFGTRGRNVNLHLARLIHAMGLLRMEVPSFLNEAMLSGEITRLLNKNRIFGSARIRLTVFRNQGGLYTPETNAVGITIEASPIATNLYTLNPKGYIVDIYPDMRKPANMLSSIKSCNALFYIMAGIYRKDNNLSDCILINDVGRMVEATSSNIFIVKNDDVYTPGVTEGCIPGVMRDIVIRLAPQLGLKMHNQVGIPVQKLFDCDEVFLTNAIAGIRWVAGFRQQRYFNRVSRMLVDAINRFTFPDQFSEGFSG
jgi:branched-chain amino acid aminotransferase